MRYRKLLQISQQIAKVSGATIISRTIFLTCVIDFSSVLKKRELARIPYANPREVNTQ
jgi:hypothetical protein